jgi:hypothetical protein
LQTWAADDKPPPMQSKSAMNQHTLLFRQDLAPEASTSICAFKEPPKRLWSSTLRTRPGQAH